MIVRLVFFVLLALLVPACSHGDSASPRSEAIQARRAPGAIERSLVEPDVVLTRADLALTDAQRTDITTRSRATQTELEVLDARLDTVTRALEAVLAQVPIDEEAAVAAARAVTEVEAEIKLTHLRLLVQIRNALTPEQVARLR